ncbi:tetratricopeptide repeat protein [Selenomonas ruminantium]|uniref:TPR repeat n=1 Tax=Selenomonas ruminantium TaxID=971 RepID=A0A1H3X708_SELRU|nr:tetratricopeptide repeat protein [Selenomonas ruminantium]SDZ94338.1 TPR repeat [Selenomonas ruminantium]
MAKKIKFTLEMKDGVQVRTLEDLQENFDMEKVVGYFTDGRLQTWLEERYYEEEAEAVSKLSKSTPDFHKKLCEALGVTVVDDELSAIDIDEVERRKQRLEHLRQYTGDKNILDKVDMIAFNQEELGDLLSDGVSEIILCHNRFRIPLKQKNKKYIGVGRVEAIIKSSEKVDFDALGISFVNVKFDAEYDKLEHQTSEEIYENAMKEENEEKVIALLEKACEMNNPGAMCELGKRYVTGKGVRKDAQSAFELFSRSADLGNTDAMVEIADLYFDGDDFTNDEEKSFEWYKKAAELMNFSGMVNLGACYIKGFGTEVNNEEALKWLNKALDLECGEKYKAMLWIGHLYSNETYEGYSLEKAFQWYKNGAELAESTSDIKMFGYWLGECYRLGSGVKKDLNKAQKWHYKAANAGVASAMNCMGLVYGELSESVDEYNTRMEYIEKENEWYQKAIEKGNIPAKANLAYNYQHGIGIGRSINKAIKLYSEAAEKGYISAMNNLGDIYLDNTEKFCDYQKAKSWFIKAADAGSDYAMNALGYMYKNGIGFSKNYGKAAENYRKAAEAGNVTAMLNLGQMYEDGEGVQQNYAEAASWYKAATNQGNAIAMRLIGRLYFNGLGVEKDEKLAMQWWQRSAEAGDETAKNWIEEVAKEENNDSIKTGAGILAGVAGVAGAMFLNSWMKNK